MRKLFYLSIFTFLLLISLSCFVSAENLYWVGAIGGNWSNATNWASSSGGAGGAGVPSATTSVIFDSANTNNSVINLSLTIFNLTVIGYNGTISFTRNISADLNISQNLYLGNGATIAPTYSSDSGNGSGRVITVLGNASILGSINANGLGFFGNAGPGANQHHAGHGGIGPTVSSTTYGSIAQPTSLGSGANQANQAGGGAIKLNVTQILNVTGNISAEGGGDGWSGSGGSIWLISNTFTGNGSISASARNTGDVNNMGNAGGGRVAIEYTSSSFIGRISVAGRTGQPGTSQPGTLWEPNKFAISGSYVINESYNYYFPNQSTQYNLNITVSGNATVFIRNGTLNVPNLLISNGSTLRFDVNYSGGTGVNNFHMGNFTISNSINVTGNSNLYLPAEGNYSLSRLDIYSGSTLFSVGNGTAANSASGGNSSNPHGIGVTINVNGNASILGSINANGLGFSGSSGPGDYQHYTGHGGLGPDTNTLVYGSITQPTSLGSGANQANQAGGGAIKLNVTQILNVTGNISAEGGSSGWLGSGGSIWLISNTFTGNGSISASAGEASFSNKGNAGGGRVAIEYTSSSFIGRTSVAGQVGTAGTSQPGTLWEPNKFAISGSYVINESYNYYFPNQSTLYNLNITVSGNVTVFIRNGTLNVPNLLISNGSLLRFDVNYTGGTGINQFNMGNLTVSNSINITGNSFLYLPAEGNYSLSRLDIYSGSILFPVGNGTAANSASGGDSSVPHGIGVSISVNGNASILGSINGEGLGFIGNSGPCAGKTASHGGLGGTNTLCSPYGSITKPTALGAGSWTDASTGRPGGSAIKLNVTQILNVTGNISVNGINGCVPGAGGSIWLISNTFTGNGNISASGGSPSCGVVYSGAGGRVAIEYITSSFIGRTSVAPNAGVPGGTAQPGTLWEPNKFAISGSYVINESYNYYFPNQSTSYNLNLTLLNNVTVFMLNGTLNVPNLIISNGSTLRFDVNYTGGTGINNFKMGTLTISNSINISDSSNLYLPAEGNYSLNSLDIYPGSILFSVGNGTATNVASGGNSSNPHGIGVTINVNGNASILGSINGEGLGFARISGFCAGKTGSHGGLSGTNAICHPYGSITQPTALASGSWQDTNGNPGGSAIKLNVTQILNVTGNISVNGINGCVPSSGGSIWLISNTFTGNGNISSSGGSASCGGGYAASGGRVSIEYNTSNFNGKVKIFPNGGDSGGDAQAGTYFACQTSVSGACSSSINGLKLTTDFNISSNVNITRIIGNFNQTLITLNDTSTNTSNVAIYNITGLHANVSYYVYNNHIYNRTLSSGNIGNLSLFNFTLTNNHFLNISDLDALSNPNATILDYANNSFFNNGTGLNFTVNVSDNDGVRNATFYIYNSTGLFNQSTINFASGVLNTVVGTINNLLDGVYTWWWEILDWAGNRFTTTNSTITVDLINPQISFASPTPANNSGAGSSFIVNLTIFDIHFKNITYNFNNNLLYFNISNASVSNLSNGNWSFTYNQTAVTVGQSYSYNVTVRDSSNNKNVTETRVVLGNTAPNISLYSYTPTDLNTLDPNVTISALANVTDAENNLDTVLLQWKNATSDWTNVSTINITAVGINTTINASFITNASYESNYTFRMYANDTQGSVGVSSNVTLNVFWDCDWNSTTTLGGTAGWDQNKEVGNITISNIGDASFSNSNCTLVFRLNHNLLSGRVYFDHNSLKPSNSYSIAARNNRSIQVNATFVTEVREESLVVSVNELSSSGGSNISQTYERNTTASLVSNQNGPYLYEQITSNPDSVYITDNNFSLQGYFRNLMGTPTVNSSNTAYNVSFYWVLPSGLTNISGALEMNYSNVSHNNLNYSNLNVSFSDLDSFTNGIKTIYLKVYGYNISGGLITDADQNTVLTESVNISFLCYNISDGVYVSSCGSLDGDYVAPSSSSGSSSSSSSSSSGGGGGGGGGTNVAATKADYQFVRGKTNEIVIPFLNKDINNSFRQLKFSLSGDLAKYMEISPDSLDELGPGRSVNVILRVTSPGFIKLGRQTIFFDVSGIRGGDNYYEHRSITLQVNDISKEDASRLVNDSLELLSKFNNAGFNYTEADKLVSDIRTSYDSLDYAKLKKDYEYLKNLVDTAINTKQIIYELKILIAESKEKGIDVSGSERILKLAELSLSRNQFDEAYERAKEAQTNFALEVKGELAKVSYYLKNNKKEISLSAILLFIFAFIGYKGTKLRLIINKIKNLQHEEKILHGLMQVVQRKTFIEKKMSMEEYQSAMVYYEERLSNVIEDIIELESKRAHVLSFKSNQSRLKAERDRIIALIKEIQKQYLKEKLIETRSYELRLESYNKRLSLIDEKLATLEAHQALKRILK